MLSPFFWPSVIWPPKWVHTLLECRKKTLTFIFINIILLYLNFCICFIIYKNDQHSITCMSFIRSNTYVKGQAQKNLETTAGGKQTSKLLAACGLPVGCAGQWRGFLNWKLSALGVRVAGEQHAHSRSLLPPIAFPAYFTNFPALPDLQRHVHFQPLLGLPLQLSRDPSTLELGASPFPGARM